MAKIVSTFKECFSEHLKPHLNLQVNNSGTVEITISEMVAINLWEFCNLDQRLYDGQRLLFKDTELRNLEMFLETKLSDDSVIVNVDYGKEAFEWK